MAAPGPSPEVADALAQSRQERRLRPFSHFLRQLGASGIASLTDADWDAIDDLAVIGGRSADEERNARLLEAWSRYDDLRATPMKRLDAVNQLAKEFSEFDYESLWELTAGRNRHLRNLRRKRKDF